MRSLTYLGISSVLTSKLTKQSSTLGKYGNSFCVSEQNLGIIMGGWEVKQDHLASMHKKISEPPQLLSKAAGNNSCCIFKVPHSLVNINSKSYQPRIVSIGPYHHGKPHLQMIEQHKWTYLGALLARVQKKEVFLEDLMKAVQLLEIKARECFSETIQMSTDDFVEMMVLDGCFVIELFRKVGNLIPFEPSDPIISMVWILSFFYRDLLRLENQIPFFILECLFDLSNFPGEKSNLSLSRLALEFFNHAMQRSDSDIVKHQHLNGRHLLDLVRASYIPSRIQEEAHLGENCTPTHVIHSISKLRSAGIKLRQVKDMDQSFLVVNFRGGIIHMPTITIDDFMSSLLVNCVAYEQFHKSCSKHFTSYSTLLDCLVNTSEDVEYLGDQNIVENYFGTDAEVARFINNLGKDVAFDIDRCYLSKVFNDVHEHYQSSWHVQWAGFKYTYFRTPWSFISAVAALILLVLSVAQTFFTIYPFYKRP